ncbi:MAG TPA: alpha/beta fold hydrolase [Bryobacteraceae bacterium]|nr:alpha/beta fold hydrolase [Bryobacteraceae bacterium]
MSRALRILICLVSAWCSFAQDSRRQTLELLLHVVPPSRVPDNGRLSSYENTWEEWQKRTGTEPPDFDALPSNPDLPDPLVLRENGRAIPVTNLALWNRQKQWIRAQTEHWIFGALPPPPDNLRAVVTGTSREGTVTVRRVRLEFGPDHRATLHLELIIPDGKGPFPVFLTNHGPNRPWLYTAIRRGYMVCYYSATDPNYGDPDDSDKYIELYPQYDFSCLARWGWAASRAVDYLYTLPEVDKNKIGLTGHSRNGKQSLVAAAFDERIGAVILSSGNTGECDPWRYTTDMFANESIELLTGGQPHWFHPRLRFFSGREDKLPVDQNMLMAAIAPRGLMMYSGYGESAGNPLGFEQAYRSVLRVYRFLGKEDNVWLNLRDGEHPTTTEDLENFLDFFDSVFGRRHHAKFETWILGYTFEGWQKTTGERIDPLAYPRRAPGDFLLEADGRPIGTARQWEERKKSIRQRIAQVLGEEPPRLPFAVHHKLSEKNWSSDGWLATLFGRPTDNAAGEARLKSEGMGVAGLPFGDGLKGDLFYPLGPDGKPKPGKWPVVIWLHPYSYQNGWSVGSPWLSSGWAYTLDKRPTFSLLTRRGFAVFAFDQIGFGTRVHEAREFYQRYPKWSLLGNMIADTRSAVEALAALKEIDASRIYLAGYALGAKVGLLTAAFDGRVRGLVSVCGFDPLRLDTAEKGTEGVKHYSHLHGLAPRLGFFVGHEDRLPFDFDEVLALAASKPVLLIAPTLDRYARVADVRREVEESRKVYRLLGHEEALRIETPLEINRFPHAMQEQAFDWIAQMP